MPLVEKDKRFSPSRNPSYPRRIAGRTRSLRSIDFNTGKGTCSHRLWWNSQAVQAPGGLNGLRIDPHLIVRLIWEEFP